MKPNLKGIPGRTVKFNAADCMRMFSENTMLLNHWMDNNSTTIKNTNNFKYPIPYHFDDDERVIYHNVISDLSPLKMDFEVMHTSYD